MCQNSTLHPERQNLLLLFSKRCVSLQHLIWSLTLIDQSALIAGKPREATTNDEDSELINHASSPHLINCMVDWISAENERLHDA